MPDEKKACQFFILPNVLQKKVRKTSPLANQVMIARAEESIEKIKIFHPDWLQDDVAALTSAFCEFQHTPSEKTLGRLYRASHDLRGQAALFDYPLISQVAHLLCDLIETFSDVSRPPLPLMNLHVEAIRAVLRDRIKYSENEVAQELVRELERQDRQSVAARKNERAADVALAP